MKLLVVILNYNVTELTIDPYGKPIPKHTIQAWARSWEIQAEVELDLETGKKVLAFLDVLEELDDTQAVYSNAEIPDEAYD